MFEEQNRRLTLDNQRILSITQHGVSRKQNSQW